MEDPLTFDSAYEADYTDSSTFSLSDAGETALVVLDQYATLCESLLTLVFHAMQATPSFIESSLEFLQTVFAVPLAVASALWKLLYGFIYVFTIPVRIVNAIATRFPLLSIFVVVCVVIFVYLLRKLTAQRFIQYVLHTVIPYGLSLVYTVVGIFFPQINTISRVFQALLNPIRWLLGIAEQVDRRAAPIRRTVEMFSPPDGRVTRSGRRSGDGYSSDTVRSRRNTTAIEGAGGAADEDRVLCCVCYQKEKSVLLQPCLHLCCCSDCIRSIMCSGVGEPLCPMCRTVIREHVEVYF